MGRPQRGLTYGPTLRTTRASKGPGNHCPLSFVAGTAPCSIDASAIALGLSAKLAGAIADAADGCKMPARQKHYRKALLKAAGL